MRILIPTVDYPPIEGGIATVALEVSRELAALGHEVTVLAPDLPRDFDDAVEPVRVVRFKGYHWRWARLFPLLWAAWPLAKQTDLMLAINIAYGGVLGRLARMLYRTRYVTFAYAYEFLKFKRFSLAKVLFRNLYRNAETTVAISQFTRRNLEDFGVSAHRITTIFPGARPPKAVDEETFAALRERWALGSGPIVLAVGRFIPRKGHITLVAAMPTVFESCPTTHLVMVGRGPCLEACLAKARALGIESQVHCPGYVSEQELAALYQACTVFALPTGEDEYGQVEGFGLVFSEAHAYGKPVVAGLSGGVADAVIDGETGLMVPPNDPFALAAALRELLEDPKLAQRMGEAGRQRVNDELNWRVFTQRLLQAVTAQQSPEK
jgi:phosphatidyl-myo-inositol dimannoside synthase